MAVEQVFDIEIPDEVAGKISTVGELHEYVVAELTKLGRPNINSDITYDLLRNVVCYPLGVKPEEVVPNARFCKTWALTSRAGTILPNQAVQRTVLLRRPAAQLVRYGPRPGKIWENGTK